MKLLSLTSAIIDKCNFGDSGDHNLKELEHIFSCCFAAHAAAPKHFKESPVSEHVQSVRGSAPYPISASGIDVVLLQGQHEQKVEP